MKVELISLGVLGLIASAGTLAIMPSVAGDRLAQCVPTELPSPEDEEEEDEKTPRPNA